MEQSLELTASTYLIMIGVAWVLSFVIGCVIVFIWKKSMDNVRAQTHACDYVVSGSLSYREKKDRYLYSKVNKVRRQSSSSGSGRR